MEEKQVMVQSKGISYSRNSKFSKILATVFSKGRGGDKYQKVIQSKIRNNGKSQMTGQLAKA